jgi:phosphoglycerol transferase MdoB-like AlkP superfamily enzyme
MGMPSFAEIVDFLAAISGNLFAASIGTVIWIVAARFIFKIKKWQFNAKSWKSWVFVATTAGIFILLFISCQCGGRQGSISMTGLKKLDAKSLIMEDAEVHKAKEK